MKLVTFDKSVPFSSDSSVFGRLMKPKIDDADGAYTGDKDRSDYTAEQDWRDLNAVWKSIPKKGATASLSSLKQSSLDMDEIIEGEDSDPDQGNTGRWFPNKGSWLESWQLKGEEVGKNVFTSVENDSDAVPDSLFSRGMSAGAEADVRARGDMALDDSFFEKSGKYIDASMYGSKAPFSFRGGNTIRK